MIMLTRGELPSISARVMAPPFIQAPGSRKTSLPALTFAFPDLIRIFLPESLITQTINISDIFPFRFAQKAWVALKIPVNFRKNPNEAGKRSVIHYSLVLI